MHRRIEDLPRQRHHLARGNVGPGRHGIRRHPDRRRGTGEIPTPVSIVLGRFEDIVTEPVIEFCPVAGTLTKKAYIANVDQPFDATSPGKFYLRRMGDAGSRLVLTNRRAPTTGA